MIGVMRHIVATVTAIRFALSARCDVVVDLPTRYQTVAVRLPDTQNVLRP
jgi:hypothetical protein